MIAADPLIRTFVAINRGIEALLEHLFGLRRWHPEREPAQRTDLWQQLGAQLDQTPKESGRPVIRTPLPRVVRLREVVKELLPGRPRLIPHDLVLLQLPCHFGYVRQQLAHRKSIGSQRQIERPEHVLQTQPISLLHRPIEQFLRDLKPDEIVISLRSIMTASDLQHIEAELGLEMR